jgi:hypothetical protein
MIADFEGTADRIWHRGNRSHPQDVLASNGLRRRSPPPALLVVYGYTTCSYCQALASSLPSHMQTWGPAGVYVLELLHDSNGAGDASNWRSQFGLNISKVYVGWDNAFQLTGPAYTSDPYRVLINPRNMKITETFTEYGGGTDNDALTLAQQNQ